MAVNIDNYNYSAVQRIRDFKACHTQMDFYIIPLPSRLSDLCGRRGRKNIRPIGGR